MASQARRSIKLNSMAHVASTQERRWPHDVSTYMKTTIVISLACSFFLLGLSACSNDSAEEVDQRAAASEVHDDSLPFRSRGVEQDGAEAPSRDAPGSQVLGARHANLLALSEEEAAWLDRHGYPTQAELDALLTYDVDDLSSATRNRKDPKSAALLGHRLMIDGDLDGAWAAFEVGAGLGSLYAMQQVAIVSAQRATGLPTENLAQADQGNLGVMVARLEVARMLGDHRAQVLIDRYAKNFHWDVYGKQVLAQTAIFMDQYGEYARARGERVRGPDPRPNADAWANLEKDPNGLVTVYTRGRSWP